MITKLKNNKRLISTLIPLLIIILLITFKIITKNDLIIDKLAYKILVEKLRSPNLTIIMKIVTKLSDTIFIITLTIILIILFTFRWKKQNIAKLIPTSLIIVTSLNQSLKYLIRRDRPNGYRLIEMTGYSFPSGHAMISLAFYGLLIYIIYHLIDNQKLKICLISLNIIIIILIGISRVYLGVHYLSDIITGYSISTIYLIILAKILKKYNFFP